MSQNPSVPPVTDAEAALVRLLTAIVHDSYPGDPDHTPRADVAIVRAEIARSSRRSTSMTDDHYPTEDELKRIAEWPLEPDAAQQAIAWLDYVKSLWWAADWGWSEPEYLAAQHGTGEDKVYRFSTGGWSGNELLVDAMQQSMLWHLCWFNSRRGGHFELRIPQMYSADQARDQLNTTPPPPSDPA